MQLRDPDKTLADALAAATFWERAKTGSVQEAGYAEAVNNGLVLLDAHLRAGGELPAAWKPAGWANAMAAKNTEIAQLKAQLDGFGERLVLNAPRTVCLEIVLGVREFGHEKDNVLLRATDTGQEWKLDNGVWEPVPA